MARGRKDGSRTNIRPKGVDSVPPALDAPPSRAVAWLLFVVLAVALYGLGVGNGFTYDDRPFLENNASIRSLDGIRYLLLEPITEGQTLRAHAYRPLAAFFQYLLGTGFGFTAATFHVANLLLYGILGGLLWEALRRVAPPVVAWIATLVFLVHPIHTEAVASAVSITELLAAIFVVLSWLLAWTPSLGRWRWPAAATALLAALLCKETAIALAPIAALGGWVRGDGRRPLVVSTLGPLLPLAIYLALRFNVIGSLIAAPELGFSPIDNPLVELAAADRVRNAVVLLARSLFLLVWPATLSADYSLASLPLVTSAWPWMLALALHLALVTTAWVARRRAPAVTLGLAVFYLGLLPTSNLLFPSATIFAERFLLLPALAVCLPAAWLLARARHRPRARAALAVILIAGAARTIARLPDWRDDLTLFRAVAESYPRNAKARHNIAVLLQRQGDARAALEEARLAVDIHPRFGDARVLLSQLLAAEEPAAALEVARTGVALLPGHEDLWVQLGQLHVARGELEQAHAALTSGFARLPASYRLPYNLAMVELATGRPDAALPLLRHVLARADLPDANYALGRILLERGDPATARPFLEKGLRSARLGDDARTLLAVAHIHTGAPQAALDVLGRPASPQAALLAAIALLRVGRIAEGKAVLAQLGIQGLEGCPPPGTPLGDLCRAALGGSGS